MKIMTPVRNKPPPSTIHAMPAPSISEKYIATAPAVRKMPKILNKIPKLLILSPPKFTSRKTVRVSL
jgi:hypothetical protein